MESVFKFQEVPILRTHINANNASVQYQGYVEVIGVKTGTRFLYFLVDRIIGYIFALILLSLFLIPDYLFNDGAIIQFFDTPLGGIIDRLISWILVSFLYYFICELLLSTSFAKWMFGYVVVDEFGNKPTRKQIFIRSLSRIVPLEPFSCFSWLGWHDQWSDTHVISKRELAELKTLWQSSQL
jgi:uncharacterized RDD family membrane protein YckC